MTLYEINYIFQNNQTVPTAIFFLFFSPFLLQAAKQLDSIPDISFHEKKKKKSQQTQSREWGEKGCQLRGSRLGGGSLDLVFNLAVLSPGRLAKVTEQ